MAKVGILMDSDRPDARLSAHFGRAAWIMLADPADKTIEFVTNEGGNGGGALAAAIRSGCADLIFTHIGEGALNRLSASNIRGWVAPAGASGFDALRMFAESQLPPATAADAHAGTGSCCHGGSGHSGAGCCHGHQAGEHAAPRTGE